MSSALAPSAAVRTMTPPFGRSSFLRMSRRRVRSSSSSRRETPRPSPLGTKTTNRPGKRDLGRQPRALRLHRVLDRLDEDLLSTRDQVLDLALALALQLGADDLVDEQEPVLLEADLDECGLHAGEDVVDLPLVDVAGDRATFGALEVDLGHLAVLQDGDPLLADVGRNDELALCRRKRRALGCDATALAAAASAALGLSLGPLRGRRLGLRLFLLLRLSLRGRSGLSAVASAAATASTPRGLRCVLAGWGGLLGRFYFRCFFGCFFDRGRGLFGLLRFELLLPSSEPGQTKSPSRARARASLGAAGGTCAASYGWKTSCVLR